jgi:hypothetical protein
MADKDHPRPTWWLPLGVLLAVRLLGLIAQPIEGLLGYGDFIHFFRLAQLPGWPYLQYWSEFPPIFPFLSHLLALVAHGQEHVYDYLLAAILIATDCGSLVCFTRLARRNWAPGSAETRVWIFTAILAGLPYCGWYFDPLAVFCLLLALDCFYDKKTAWLGVVAGVGTLIKLFPVLVLGAAWRFWPWKKALKATAITVAICLVVYAGLFAASPQYTASSIVSQFSKGSWETVWALLDGNLSTGNFGPEIERLNPNTAYQAMGNTAKIPTLIPLGLLALAGLLIFAKMKVQESNNPSILVGVAWCFIILASAGWSPQWVLYILPIVMLTLPVERGVLFSGALILVNLLEWPVLLSRGMFAYLWLPILVRTLLLVLLSLVWIEQLFKPELVREKD